MQVWEDIRFSGLSGRILSKILLGLPPRVDERRPLTRDDLDLPDPISKLRTADCPTECRQIGLEGTVKFCMELYVPSFSIE